MLCHALEVSPETRSPVMYGRGSPLKPGRSRPTAPSMIHAAESSLGAGRIRFEHTAPKKRPRIGATGPLAAVPGAETESTDAPRHRSRPRRRNKQLSIEILCGICLRRSCAVEISARSRVAAGTGSSNPSTSSGESVEPDVRGTQQRRKSRPCSRARPRGPQHTA